MNAYMIGNFVGRILVNYLVVWLVLFLFSRFNWRRAFRQVHSWYGLFSVILLLLLGLAGASLRT